MKNIKLFALKNVCRARVHTPNLTIWAQYVVPAPLPVPLPVPVPVPLSVSIPVSVIQTRICHPKPVFMLKIGKKYFSIIRSKFNIKHRKFSFAASFAQFSQLFDEYNIF